MKFAKLACPAILGNGSFQLMNDLPCERMLISVMALASMERAFEATLAYTSERRAFGQSIADFQRR